MVSIRNQTSSPFLNLRKVFMSIARSGVIPVLPFSSSLDSLRSRFRFFGVVRPETRGLDEDPGVEAVLTFFA